MNLSRLCLWLDSAIFKFSFGREIHFKQTQNIAKFSLTFPLFPFKSRVLIV